MASSKTPPKTKLKVPELQNAMIAEVIIGSRAHSGDGFFTLVLAGDGWIDMFSPPFDPTVIDSIIAVAGRQDLMDCKNCYIRVIQEHGVIVGLAHVIHDSIAFKLEIH